MLETENPFNFLTDFARWFDWGRLVHFEKIPPHNAAAYMPIAAGVDLKTGQPVYRGSDGKYYPITFDSPGGPVKTAKNVAVVGECVLNALGLAEIQYDYRVYI